MRYFSIMSDPVAAAVYRTMNAGFVQEMYEQYLRDPASVDPEWRALFENGGRGLEPVTGATETTVARSVDREAAISSATALPRSDAPPPSIAGTAQPMKGAAARLAANM